LSLASRLKSGFGPAELASIPAQLSHGRDELKKSVSALSTGEVTPERISSLLYEFCHNTLIRSIQSMFNGNSTQTTQTREKLNLFRISHSMVTTKSVWLSLGEAEKLKQLSALGLDLLPKEELILIGMQSAVSLLGSTLMNGESRSGKLTLLARASRLRVINLQDEDSTKFVVVDEENKLRSAEFTKWIYHMHSKSTFSHFVSHGADYHIYCQCQADASSGSVKLCEHLCAVGLVRPAFVESLVPTKKRDEKSKTKWESAEERMSTTLPEKEMLGVEEVKSEQNDEIECNTEGLMAPLNMCM